MKKLLLFAFLAFGIEAMAQIDSTRLISNAAPVDLSKAPADTVAKVICTDTVRLGNFYISAGIGSRVSFSKVYSGSGGQNHLTNWGSNYGISAGYKTLNNKFLFEVGYLVRELNNVNRFSFFGKDLDLIVSSEMKQVPFLLKTRILNKASGKIQLRAITGLNFTWINEEAYALAGSFDEISRSGNLFTLKTKKPYYMDEVFVVNRDARTSKDGNNLHLTAEVGFEGSYILTKSLETGASITYQYFKGPFERLNIDFIGNERLGKTHYAANAPDPSLDLIFYLRYHFGNITFLKCKKAKK